MSAFVVTNKTINQPLGFLYFSRESHLRRFIQDRLGVDLLNSEDYARLAREMFALNCKSIDARYGEGEAAAFRPLDFEPRYEPCNRVQALKSLQCWLYQCSEGDIPGESLLYSTMKELCGLLAQDIVSKLPEYTAARWDA